jgi:hypothetical protein
MHALDCPCGITRTVPTTMTSSALAGNTLRPITSMTASPTIHPAARRRQRPERRARDVFGGGNSELWRSLDSPRRLILHVGPAAHPAAGLAWAPRRPGGRRGRRPAPRARGVRRRCLRWRGHGAAARAWGVRGDRRDRCGGATPPGRIHLQPVGGEPRLCRAAPQPGGQAAGLRDRCGVPSWRRRCLRLGRGDGRSGAGSEPRKHRRVRCHHRDVRPVDAVHPVVGHRASLRAEPARGGDHRWRTATEMSGAQ